MYNPVYRNPNRDIGFELGADELGDFLTTGKARVSSGYRYWARDDRTYDESRAAAQVTEDAKKFVADRKKTLEQAEQYLNGKDACLVCALPAATLGQDWMEGVSFLEQVLRSADGFSFAGCADLLDEQFSLPKINPYPAAAIGIGNGESLLDSSNNWMLLHLRKMCERMVDLAGRFPDDSGLTVRLLNLGAKELMISQSGEWPLMLHEGRFPEYVTARFKESIASFIAVFDSLGSNTVSTEWLTKMEHAHPLFPWINYRIFSKKK